MTVLALNHGLGVLKCGLQCGQADAVKPLLARLPKAQAIRQHRVQGAGSAGCIRGLA